MSRRRFLAVTVLLAFLMSFAFGGSNESKASTFWDPFALTGALNFQTSLDPTDPLHTATMLLVDPGDYADLLLAYARCSNPGTPALYGVTVGTMYCIKSFIKIATHFYTTGLNNTNNVNVLGIPINFFVKAYQTACWLLGISLFGLRMMTFQTKSVSKETFQFLTRLCFSMFLVTQAPLLFDTFLNVIGEGIGWLNGILGLAVPPASCFDISLLKVALQTVDPSTAGAGYDEYEVWHMVDCVFLNIFGAGPPSTNSLGSFASLLPTSFLSSLNVGQDRLIYAGALPIIAGAIFTSTVGMGVGLVALSGLVAFIELIMKAMFTVLTAYLTLSMFTLLTPFMAPLLVFNTHTSDGYTNEFFRKWTFILFGAVIQPVIIIAYLAFAAVLMDAFMEGDISPDPAINGIFAACTPGVTSDNICTFHQLFKPFPDWTVGGIPNPVALGNYGYMEEMNPVIANWHIIGDPQATSSDCTMIDRTLTYIRQTGFDMANQVDSKASGVELFGPTRLKTPNIKLLQLSLTFVSFMITAITLNQLMGVIPTLAESLGGGMGINLWHQKIPFIDLIKAGIEGADKGSREAGGKGLLAGGGAGGLKGMSSALTKSLEGAATGMAKMITGR